MTPTERFAPSPTGELHLGHAFSAALAHDSARRAGGRFLLRIEDIDTGRSRPAFVDAIFADLAWLGLHWDAPPLVQSSRAAAHRAAVAALYEMGMLYACTCTRKEIADALSAPQEGAPPAAYPSVCRGRTIEEARRSGRDFALRINLDKAFDAVGQLRFTEIGDDAPAEITVDPAALRAELGDAVISRKDIGPSYHVAVVVDDAFQGVTHVTRGRDIASATGLHAILQILLRAPRPTYRHHRLIRDDAGKRLAKRDDAKSLRALREAGATPADIRAMVGLPTHRPE